MFEKHELGVKTEKENITNITEKISQTVLESGVEKGFCLVFCPHTTAGIIINEDDPGLRKDFLESFKNMVLESKDYRHDRIDNNATSHVKNVLTSSDHTIPISDGELELGTWQNLMLIETDGPRNRTVRIYIIGD